MHLSETLWAGSTQAVILFIIHTMEYMNILFIYGTLVRCALNLTL